MRKIRLLTKSGIARAYSLKVPKGGLSMRGLMYVPKFKAYAKMSDALASDLRAGLKVEFARGKFAGLKNVQSFLNRFEQRKRLLGYDETIAEMKRNLTVKRPRFNTVRIENALSSIEEKQMENYQKGGEIPMPRAELVTRMREFLKAKKQSIATGRAMPNFKDYIKY